MGNPALRCIAFNAAGVSSATLSLKWLGEAGNDNNAAELVFSLLYLNFAREKYSRSYKCLYLQRAFVTKLLAKFDRKYDSTFTSCQFCVLRLFFHLLGW